MSQFKITMENPHAYQTRDGVPVEIVYIFPGEDIRQPVIAKVPDGDKDILVTYAINGFYYKDGGESEYDLIPIPKKQKYKVVMNKVGNTYYTMTCNDEAHYAAIKADKVYVRDLTDWIEYTP